MFETRDKIFNIGAPSFEDKFWIVKNIVNRPLGKSENNTVLLQTQLYLDPQNSGYAR